jgi:hypothetical protein
VASLLLTPLAFAGNAPFNKNLAGAYMARVAKTAPSMTVSLGEDGTATVTGDPGTGSFTSFGHWTSNGNQVKVTFDAEADQPATPPMVFETSHNQLKAVTWDRQNWGTKPPPVMEKGYKVKYLFWSTSMR